MSRREKLLAKARNNPEGLGFNEFLTLLSQYGFTHNRTSGSHQIWVSEGTIISVQPKGSKAKGYQVRQFLKVCDNE